MVSYTVLLQLLTEVICFAYCLYMMVVFTQEKLCVCLSIRVRNYFGSSNCSKYLL